MRCFWNKLSTTENKLLIAVLCAFAVFFFLENSLSSADMRMKRWVYICFFVITLPCFAGVLLRKLKRWLKLDFYKWRDTILVLLIAVPIFLLGWWYGMISLAFAPQVYSVEADGKAYVAYVGGFRRASVDYYEDINFFIRGNCVMINEFYFHTMDPFRSDDTGEFLPESERPAPTERIVYDKDGNLIEIWPPMEDGNLLGS